MFHCYRTSVCVVIVSLVTEITMDDVTSSEEIPHDFLEIVISHIGNYKNDTMDFKKPHLRIGLEKIYPLFVYAYLLLLCGGILLNSLMLRHIVVNRLHRHDRTHLLLISLAVSNILNNMFVLPFTLTNLLVQNWLFGRILCYVLPMTQDIPIHVSILTYVVIALHRYRCIMHPMKPKIPTYLMMTSVWIVSVCIVLPYLFYVHYIDIQKYMRLFLPDEESKFEQFKGSGLCTVNVEIIHEYMRGMFVVLYTLPITIIAFLYIKISGEIKNKERGMALSEYEFSPDTNRSDFLDIYWNDERNKEGRVSTSTIECKSSIDSQLRSETRSKYSVESYNNNIDFDEDVDWSGEKRTQNYLVTMVSLFTICLLPLNGLRLIKHILEETSENKLQFDYTYISFVWIAFIPTVSTPVVYWFWHKKPGLR